MFPRIPWVKLSCGPRRFVLVIARRKKEDLTMRTRLTTLVGALSLCVLLAAGAWAQGLAELKKTTPEQRTTLLTDMMRARLQLTESQVGQVREINLKYAKQMQPILEGSERPFKEVWELQDLNHGKEAELKKVLSPEQFQQYLVAKDELRQKLEQRIWERKAEARKQGTPE
jgi:hypothetical protein